MAKKNTTAGPIVARFDAHNARVDMVSNGSSISVLPNGDIEIRGKDGGVTVSSDGITWTARK